MNYSPPLFDAGSPIIWVMYGAFWGIVSFIVAVVSEFFVLRYGFKFQKVNRFRFTLIANAASALIGTIPVLFLYLVAFSRTWILLLSFIFTIVIENYVWKRLIKPEEFRKKTILRYSIVANTVSYVLIFGGIFLIRTAIFRIQVINLVNQMNGF